MKSLTDLLMVISFAAPLSSALTCMILLIVRYSEKDKYGKTKHSKLLILYFFVLSLVCALVLFNLYHVSSGSRLACVLFMFSSMYSVVLFYHIIRQVMSIQNKPKIAKIHYFMPLVVAVTYSFLFYGTPLCIFAKPTSTGFLGLNPNALHSIAFSSKYWIWFAYKVIYSLIILRQLFIYRKRIIDYSAEQDRTSMNWLMWIICINIIFIPLTITQLMLNGDHFLVPLLVYITNLMLMFQSVILFYNMFINNYVIIPSESKKINQESSPLSLKIDKTFFEDYIAKEKPYLNPELRITDLILPLGTNRTYLSNFINNVYGVSFSTYINNCRIKELEKFQSNPKMGKYSDEDLVFLAGFTSYRGYKRFVKEKEN